MIVPILSFIKDCSANRLLEQKLTFVSSLKIFFLCGTCINFSLYLYIIQTLLLFYRKNRNQSSKKAVNIKVKFTHNSSFLTLSHILADELIVTLFEPQFTKMQYFNPSPVKIKYS